MIFWRITCPFPVFTKPKGSLPSSRTTPAQPALKLAALLPVTSLFTSLYSLSLSLLLCCWKVYKKPPGEGCSPLSFSNYCLRKPERVTPIPKMDMFIPKTTLFIPPSPAGTILPHHIATQLSHTANCGYSSGILYSRIHYNSPFWNTSFIMPGKETDLPNPPAKPQLSTEKPTV